MVHPKREYSMVVLGAGGVGKSCLTAQFVNNIWIESYDPTIEDSYRKLVDIDGEPIILEILDTAGTEQFTSMREIYMKSGQGFLLVYSITSLNTLAELPIIRDQILRIKEVDTVPLVLVGNKSDLEQDRAVSRNRASYLARKLGNAVLYETSARKRINVDEIFMDLSRQIMRANGDIPNPYRHAGGTKQDRRNRQKGDHFCIIL